VWSQDASGRVHTPAEPVVLAATLALIPVLIVEADANSAVWQRAAEVANWFIWAVFAIELGAVLIVASRGRRSPGCDWPAFSASLASGSSSAVRCKPSVA
jgi:hypothetical protein